MDRQFNKISVILIPHIDPNVDYEALQIPSEFNISYFIIYLIFIFF